MTKNNFDKIILLSCLLIASILFYQNQQNYKSILSDKLEEISHSKIKRLQTKHFDLRNKYVQHNDAGKHGIALSDLFLNCAKAVEKSENLEEAYRSIKTHAQIQLYIEEEELYELKSIEEIMSHILNLFEKIVLEKKTKDKYNTKFTILTENLVLEKEELTFTVRPFESYQIPEGKLTVTSNGDTLDINSAPSSFCMTLKNLEFHSDLNIKNTILP